jgi:hypothetical protein
MTEFADYEAEVCAEVAAQEEKWGLNQTHPDVDQVLMNREGGATARRMAEHYEIPTASRAKFSCNLADRRGELTWADIAVEELAEVIEAATQKGASETRYELVQLEAVCRSWRMDMDRRPKQ